MSIQTYKHLYVLRPQASIVILWTVGKLSHVLSEIIKRFEYVNIARTIIHCPDINAKMAYLQDRHGRRRLPIWRQQPMQIFEVTRPSSIIDTAVTETQQTASFQSLFPIQSVSSFCDDLSHTTVGCWHSLPPYCTDPIRSKSSSSSWSGISGWPGYRGSRLSSFSVYRCKVRQ